MLRRKDEHGTGGDEVEFECPVCGTIFKASERAAEKGLLKCPRGHEFGVMGMLGGAGLEGPGGKGGGERG